MLKHNTILAYGGCARLALPPKRPDKSDSSQLAQKKGNAKFLWLPLMPNLRILGLIWQGIAYCVQNETTIIISYHSVHLLIILG